MVKFVPIMTAIIISGLFIVSLLYGGLLFQIQNNAPVKLTDDPAIAGFGDNITQALGDTSNNLNSADTTFKNSSITTTGGNPYITAMGGLWQVIKSGPTLIWNVYSAYIINKLLGGGTLAYIIGSSLAAILILIVISSIIYLVVKGEGG